MPAVEPFATGRLAVPGGHELYWETTGRADGQPAIWLHGGPGSGLGSGGYRQRIDPDHWCLVGYDQRGCGRSTPLATTPGYDLAAVETQRHIEDIESLREHLGFERWLVTGGSWGSTLAIAYAQAHPERVTGLVLVAVTTGSRSEVEWITESVGRIFPREWEAYAAASGRRPGQRVVEAYYERLTDPDPEVRAAAALAWCTWEDTCLAGRRLGSGPTLRGLGLPFAVRHIGCALLGPRRLPRARIARDHGQDCASPSRAHPWSA